jgi:tetratricopeptide (TPR) repeat protein
LDDYNTVEAQEALNRALKEYPQSMMLRRLQVTALIDRGELKGAELLLDEYFRDDKSMTTEENRFLLAMKQCRYEDACEVYIQTLADGRTTPERSCARLDEVSEAIPRDVYVRAMQRMGTLFPDNLSLQQEVGANLLRAEAMEEALPFLNHALDLDAYNAVTWENVARCQFHLKQHEDCVKSCTLGLSLDENNLFLRFFRGSIFFEREQYADAIKDLEVAYDIFSGEIKEKVVRGSFPEKDKDALRDETIKMLACSHEGLEQMDQCIEYWKDLCYIHYEDAQIYYELALRQMDYGDLPAALKSSSRCVRYAPDNERYLLLHASLVISCGESTEKIEKALVNVLKVNPDSAIAWAALAELYKQLGKKDRAHQCFCALRDLKPTDAHLINNLVTYFESIGEPLDPSQFPTNPEA